MGASVVSVTKTKAKVLLLIDWDNLFISLYHFFGPDGMDMDKRIKMLITWIEREIGEILGEHGFVFTHEYMSSMHHQMCTDNKLKIVICPKKPGGKDTVDENIIWFCDLMARHQDIKYVCLVSGDSDFVGMLKKAKEHKIKVALVLPTINCFSASKDLTELADKKPRSKDRMILMLDQT